MEQGASLSGKGGPINEDSAMEGSAMEGSAKQGSAKEGSAMEGSAKQGSAMEGSAKQGSAMEGSAKQGSEPKPPSRNPSLSNASVGDKAPSALPFFGIPCTSRKTPLKDQLAELQQVNALRAKAREGECVMGRGPACGAHQRPSAPISAHQRPSAHISAHQRTSAHISAHQDGPQGTSPRPSVCPSAHISALERAHQYAFSGRHPRRAPLYSSHTLPSIYPKTSPLPPPASSSEMALCLRRCTSLRCAAFCSSSCASVPELRLLLSCHSAWLLSLTGLSSHCGLCYCI